MKKILSLLLALCLTAALFGGAVTADAADAENEAVFAARAMGIMTGDENGSMNLTSNVTRAEFAKMMVCASKYKNGVGTSVGVSLYKDVKSTHWASQYIKLAVEEGWFQGYVDGTFRPSGLITVEEGATVVLRALGYGSEDLMGAFPSAQLSKYVALGLSDGILKTQGQNLSRQDCAQLFFNMMSTETKAGKDYGVTLGYTVTNGKINYSALVNSNMKGPYIANAGGAGIPISNPTVIKNGKNISMSQIAQYDVYYFNAGMKTVWVYSDKAVGTLTAISPNTSSPESVTVGGKTYALSTSEAQYAVSDMGSYKKGDTVTLLLDRSGAAAYVSGTESVTGVFYGVVLSYEKQTITTGGNASNVYSIKVACTDGEERSVISKDDYCEPGRVVMVKYNKGETTVTQLSTRSLSGKFTTDTFAGKKLSETVKILDVFGTSYTNVWPERLKGYTLESDAVRYYEVNSSGEIEHMILNNATGDAAIYAYVTGKQELVDGEGNNLTSIYTYLLNGTEQVIKTDRVIMGAKFGAAALNMTDGKVSSFTALKSFSVSSVTELQAVTPSKNYQLADNLQVYLRKNSTYQLVALNDVLNNSRYNYTAWVDEAKTGGRVRILVATEK